MIERIRQKLSVLDDLDSTRIWVIGVSGGPDSLCLLDAMHLAGKRIVAAHLNHCLRSEADQEAEQVRWAVEQYGIPFVLKVVDVSAYAERDSLSIEEAARIVRYRFLFDEAVRFDARAVLVGHTADDQVETVLMHLLRGAGLEGLKGMESCQLPNAWSKEIPLVRPLLSLWRQETVAYCLERGLHPVMDPSNLERTYYRNRLRLELIPVLETYAPNIKEIVIRMAETLRGDQQVLEPVVAAAWQTCLRQAGAGYAAFEKENFQAQQVGIKRRLLRKAMDLQRPGLRDIGFETIERALHFVQKPEPTGQLDLAAGLRLFVEGELIWIAAWEADLPGMGWPQIRNGGEPIRLSLPGTAGLADGWQLHLEEALDLDEGRQKALVNTDPYQVWLDAGHLVSGLVVRGRHPGDRIKPLGMEGHAVKIADLMINEKMPRRARAGWPLVCCGDEVIWVPGYATSHSSRVSQETRRIYHLWLARAGRSAG
jgi:tRNA(Ile)-lysidine synthase